MSGRLSLCAVAFGVSVAVWGGSAVIAADPSPETRLSPRAQTLFQAYRDVPRSFGYRAFAVGPESVVSGQSMRLSQPRIAIDQAIEDCQRRSARTCQVHGVGDIIVLGLADWKTEVALALYRVKTDATNDDLDAVTLTGGGSGDAD